MANGNSETLNESLISGLKQATPAQRKELQRLLNLKAPPAGRRAKGTAEEVEEEVADDADVITLGQLASLLPNAPLPGNFTYQTTRHPLEDALLLAKTYSPTKEKRDQASRQYDTLIFEGRKKKAGDIAVQVIAGVGAFFFVCGAIFLVNAAGTWLVKVGTGR